VEPSVTFQNFIVLGIIPGTDYQISFYGWLLTVLAVLLSLPLLFALRTQLRVIRAVFQNQAALFTPHPNDISI
jgi:hypothetical protein